MTDETDPPGDCGRIVSVSFLEYQVQDDCDGFLAGTGEFRFRLNVDPPGPQLCEFSQNNNDLDDNRTHTFRSNACQFLLRPGERFSVAGTVTEDDPGSNDPRWRIGAHRFSFESLPSGRVTISPRPGEANDGCFDGHKLIVNISATQG